MKHVGFSNQMSEMNQNFILRPLIEIKIFKNQSYKLTETDRKREQYQTRQNESDVRISEITRGIYETAYECLSSEN